VKEIVQLRENLTKIEKTMQELEQEVSNARQIHPREDA